MVCVRVVGGFSGFCVLTCCLRVGFDVMFTLIFCFVLSLFSECFVIFAVCYACLVGFDCCWVWLIDYDFV